MEKKGLEKESKRKRGRYSSLIRKWSGLERVEGSEFQGISRRA